MENDIILKSVNADHEPKAVLDPKITIPPQLASSVEVTPIAVESQGESSRSATPLPTVPCRPAASVFHGERFVDKWERQCLQMLWSELSTKITNTPLDMMSSLKDEIPVVLKRLENFKCDDIPPLIAMLEAFFEKVEKFDSARSVIADMPSYGSFTQRITESGTRLEEAKADMANGSKEVKAMRKKLKSLKKEVTNLEQDIKVKAASLKTMKTNITEMEGEIAELNNTSAPYDEAQKNFDTLRAELETSHEELKTLKPF